LQAAVADPLKDRRCVMRTLGYVAAVTIAVTGAALGLAVVKSLPDVQRYLKIRRM
jgi:hypothetical protein